MLQLTSFTGNLSESLVYPQLFTKCLVYPQLFTKWLICKFWYQNPFNSKQQQYNNNTWSWGCISFHRIIWRCSRRFWQLLEPLCHHLHPCNLVWLWRWQVLPWSFHDYCWSKEQCFTKMNTWLLTDVADISETISHKKFHEISSSFVRYNAARSDKTNS